MARRSPMNERYQKNTASSGKTRRSAASAKPRRDSGKPAPAAKKAPRERTPLVINPPTEEFRRLRRLWWMLLLGSVLCTFGSLGVRSWLAQPGMANAQTWATIANVLLGIGYAGIFAALYLDWTKLRKMRQEWTDLQRTGNAPKPEAKTGKQADKSEAAEGDSAGDKS